MKKAFFVFIMLIISTEVIAQTDTIPSYANLKVKLADYVTEIDTVTYNKLVSAKGFNLFLQKKMSIYLTGSSEISLSQLYATYSTNNDKLTFGLNFKRISNDDGRLKYLFNPLLETDVKNNFATLYKKEEWQSNIRGGFKFSYFFSSSTINFYGIDNPNDQKSKMMKKRNEALIAISESIDKTRINYSRSNNPELLHNQKKLLENFKKKKEYISNKEQKTVDDIEEIKIIEKSISRLESLINDNANAEVDYKKLMEEYEDKIADAELAALYEKNSYTWFQTSWLSVWGFVPLTERKTFVAQNNTQSFVQRKQNLWDANLQWNYLTESQKRSFYIAIGYKAFQNNSALADLMTSVDYYQYSQFPNTTVSNLAVLKNYKAFIGDYKDFVTNNLNLQLVLSLSDKRLKGGERFITPGVSARLEQNFGEYSARNLAFGLPLRFKGENKAVNIEPQIRLNNTNNYEDKIDYKVQPTFGVSVGLPFTALFK